MEAPNVIGLLHRYLLSFNSSSKSFSFLLVYPCSSSLHLTRLGLPLLDAAYSVLWPFSLDRHATDDKWVNTVTQFSALLQIGCEPRETWWFKLKANFFGFGCLNPRWRRSPICFWPKFPPSRRFRLWKIRVFAGRGVRLRVWRGLLRNVRWKKRDARLARYSNFGISNYETNKNSMARHRKAVKKNNRLFPEKPRVNPFTWHFALKVKTPEGKVQMVKELDRRRVESPPVHLPLLASAAAI